MGFNSGFKGLMDLSQSSSFYISLSRKLAVRPRSFWSNEAKPLSVKFQAFNLKVFFYYSPAEHD